MELVMLRAATRGGNQNREVWRNEIRPQIQ
jgi:hypothetical protein